jgi:hypothetical protein
MGEGKMTNDEIEQTRDRYIKAMRPLFLPDDPVSADIIKYFASLLRVVGMEDKGWDPYLESRAILQDLDAILQLDLPEDRFPDKHLTTWRMGLLMYSHMVEMDAPYEVLTNLLRFRLGKGYSPNPYHMFLTKDQQKRSVKLGVYPKQKIEIIKKLSQEAGLAVGDLFDEFYDNTLRNAISHSDYIITETEFRSRQGTGAVGAFSIPLEKLNVTITKAQLFVSAFFELERAARHVWGNQARRAIPYDLAYKGLMEVLADKDGLLCGFKVHWPNNSESFYRRTDDGIDMVNCNLDFKGATISLFVGLYARKRGAFSPLVEHDGVPQYTKLEGVDDPPKWPESVSAKPSS